MECTLFITFTSVGGSPSTKKCNPEKGAKLCSLVVSRGIDGGPQKKKKKRLFLDIEASVICTKSFRVGCGYLSRKVLKIVNFDVLAFAIFSSSHFYYSKKTKCCGLFIVFFYIYIGYIGAL